MNQYKAGIFLQYSLTNGMLHYVPNLARITFKFCKSHASSRYMREFIEQEIVEFAKANPATVVYLRPRRHRDPSIVAEYVNGHREQLRCNPFLKNELIKWVEHLRTSAGHDARKLLRYQATSTPSIQGPWHPWVHRKTENNFKTLPSEELSRAIEKMPSATQRVLDAAAIRLR
ncbi:39S ribosomal protein L43, mitochondrial-like [Varroa jacobsoni]|uniref:Large ribosomal subunit protein mL43 n=1 Tax=Varroa destructor TaxID=109461 RepID=A0A7M7JQI5_VARDE|nr:39S ribosomal protein L43, mitochondrial-like [Varroa destructor]XP_022694759.1 39S ribosomal protein L43, mitochondrial-like [Varroa jacobsoni]